MSVRLEQVAVCGDLLSFCDIIPIFSLADIQTVFGAAGKASKKEAIAIVPQF